MNIIKIFLLNTNKYLLSTNVFVTSVVIYIIYLLIVYILSIPTKKIIKAIIGKSKTNIDDIIFEKVKGWIKILILLVGFNLIYYIYFSSSKLPYVILSHKILLTAEIIVVWVISFKVISVIRDFFIKKFKNILSPNGINILKILVDIFLGIILFIFILNTWGINIAPLLASAGIVGFAIAMASKEIIANFLSGIILFLDKSINVGDVITLSDGTVAKIVSVNIRTTHLRKFDGNIVIIPNSKFLNEKVENKSQPKISQTKRLEVLIGISYGCDVDKAKQLLKSYLEEIEVGDKSTIQVFLDSLGDWSVNIKGRIEIPANKYSFMFEKQILEKVYKEFPKHGLTFPFPTYTIELNK